MQPDAPLPAYPLIPATPPVPANPLLAVPGLAASTLRRTWRRVVFAAVPGICRFCDQATGQARDLCDHCAGDLPWLGHACHRCGMPHVAPASTCPACPRQAPSLDRTVAAFIYAPPIDRLVADVKFHGRLTTAPLLAQLLADAIERAYSPARPGESCGSAGTQAEARSPDDGFPEMLVPVPLSTRRLLRRGHDQAWLLATQVRRRLQDAGRPITFAGSTLRRVRHTAAQSGQSQDARLRSLVGAFAVRTPPRVRHVALLDDVFTTGATLDAAARALRSAGVERVDAWVVARTPQAVE